MYNNQKGFTLLELLIAAAILAMVISPYFTQFVKSTEIGERSERIVRAEFIAQRVLEEEKRLPQIPDLKNNRTETIDGLIVQVTYSNETGSINKSTGELKIYNKIVNHDLSFVPIIDFADVDVRFDSMDSSVSTLASNLAFGDELTVHLNSTPTLNRYVLSYSINGGVEQNIDTITKADGESVVLRFNGTETSETSTLLNFSLANMTSGFDERTLELYEYDDDSRNFNFKTNNSSTGDTSLYLKLTTDTESNESNDLNYYWVHIAVIESEDEFVDSNDEVIYELHSAIRKE